MVRQPSNVQSVQDASGEALESPVEQVIHADALYTLDEIKRRLGVSSDTLRTMRRSGFVVRRVGNRRVVLGDELIAWVRGNGKQTTSAT